jgi:copper(I)-binding protein
MKFNSLFTSLVLTGAALSVAAAQGDAIDVQNAWARTTVPGQKATGAFMTLTAKEGAKLVSASSSVGMAQVHEMKMDAGVMKMNEVKGGLDLPAGKAVELKPGGFHVMLMDLKAPLTKGSTVPLTLVFKDTKGAESKLNLNVAVAAVAPDAAAQAAPMVHSMHMMPAKKAP